MKIIYGLLAIWCLWNATRIADQLGYVMVFGGDQSSLWAGIVLFLCGTFGFTIAAFTEKKK
jgi:hypothetical protein